MFKDTGATRPVLKSSFATLTGCVAWANYFTSVDLSFLTYHSSHFLIGMCCLKENNVSINLVQCLAHIIHTHK